MLDGSSVSTTLDLYGRLYPDEMDSWAERLDCVARHGQRRGQDGADGDEDPPAMQVAGR